MSAWKYHVYGGDGEYWGGDWIEAPNKKAAYRVALSDIKKSLRVKDMRKLINGGGRYDVISVAALRRATGKIKR